MSKDICTVNGNGGLRRKQTELRPLLKKNSQTYSTQAAVRFFIVLPGLFFRRFFGKLVKWLAEILS